MTSNSRLSRVEVHMIFADGARRQIKADRRLKHLIAKLCGIAPAVNDRRANEITLHLGKRDEDVVVDLRTRY